MNISCRLVKFGAAVEDDKLSRASFLERAYKIIQRTHQRVCRSLEKDIGRSRT